MNTYFKFHLRIDIGVLSPKRTSRQKHGSQQNSVSQAAQTSVSAWEGWTTDKSCDTFIDLM